MQNPAGLRKKELRKPMNEEIERIIEEISYWSEEDIKELALRIHEFLGEMETDAD